MFGNNASANGLYRLYMLAMRTPGQCAALVDHDICPLVALPYTAVWYTKHPQPLTTTHGRNADTRSPRCARLNGRQQVQVSCVQIYNTFWHTICRMNLQQECGHQIPALCQANRRQQVRGTLCANYTTIWHTHHPHPLTAGMQTPDRRAVPGSRTTAGAGAV
jgi:hypothetical protein